jgi:hypothetical protein
MKNSLKIFTLGMLGGIAGHLLFSASPLEAALQRAKFQSINVMNENGQRIGVLAPGDNGDGVLFLFTSKGKTSVQMGSYPTGGEAGQSLIGLNDKFNQLRLLMRLHSDNDSPTLIMKDRYGVDKIVLGLRGEAQTPYLEYKDNTGQVKDLLQSR